MPKLCKRGRKRQTFDISGSERMKQNRSSETDTERTLRTVGQIHRLGEKLI